MQQCYKLHEKTSQFGCLNYTECSFVSACCNIFYTLSVKKKRTFGVFFFALDEEERMNDFCFSEYANINCAITKKQKSFNHFKS